MQFDSLLLSVILIHLAGSFQPLPTPSIPECQRAVETPRLVAYSPQLNMFTYL